MIRSPAEISTIMPSVESSTRIEYSNRRRDWSARNSADRTSVATEPIRARIFRKRAKSSTTKLLPNVVSLPTGSMNSSTPVTTSKPVASAVTSPVVCGPRYAPSISSTMLPTASTSSGSTGSNWYPAVSKLMMRGPDLPYSLQQRGRLHGSHCGVVVVDQLLHRRRRHVEHRLGPHPEQDGER